LREPWNVDGDGDVDMNLNVDVIDFEPMPDTRLGAGVDQLRLCNEFIPCRSGISPATISEIPDGTFAEQTT